VSGQRRKEKPGKLKSLSENNLTGFLLPADNTGLSVFVP
jgi:hypothetical protein